MPDNGERGIYFGADDTSMGGGSKDKEKQPEIGQFNPRQEEVEEPPLKYADIENDLGQAGLLSKPRRFGQEALERTIYRLNLDPELEDKLLNGSYHSRDQDHLIRLLDRSEVEVNFAKAFIKYADQIIDYDPYESHDILGVINSEGSDTTLFWTYAPYLLKALTEKGIDEREALSMIFEWTKDGRSTVKHKEGESFNQVHLKGLEFLNQYKGSHQYILNADSKHVSHQFTAQEADKIADILIAEKKKEQSN